MNACMNAGMLSDENLDSNLKVDCNFPLAKQIMLLLALCVE